MATDKAANALEAASFKENIFAPVDLMEDTINNNPFVTIDDSNDDPATEGKVYLEQKPKWTVIDNCISGTQKMRDITYPAVPDSEYLKKKKKEEDIEFKKRVEQAIMTQFLGDTLDEYTGLAFMKDPTYQGAKEEIKSFIEDVDRNGTGIGTFSRNLFRSVAQYGISFIMVDAPKRNENIKTKADFDAANLSAYFILVESTDLISWRIAFESGKSILTQAVIREKVTIPKGRFGEETVNQYRILNIGQVTVLRERESNDENQKAQYDVEGMFETGLNYIPLFPAYGDPKHGTFKAEPPFLEMAYAQIKDFQILSSYDIGSEFVSFPPLILEGLDSESSEAVNSGWGPNRAFAVNAGSKVYYPELNGVGLESIKWRVEDNRKRIAEVGQSFNLEQTRRTKTATGEMLDAKIKGSKLVYTIKSCENATNEAIKAMSDINGISSYSEEDDKILFFKDFNNIPNPQAADQRFKRFVAGAITIKELLRGDIRDEIIPEDTNVDEVIQELNGFGEDPESQEITE